MKKKIRAKLMPANEARALVQTQHLELNRLENELLSMTGARDNCMTMMKHYKAKDAEKKVEIAELVSTVQTQARNLEVIQETASHGRKELALYRSETTGALLKRGLCKLGVDIKNSVTNLVARLRFKRAK